MANVWSLDGWYYSRDEVLLGPISNGELMELVARGWLKPTDMVWRGWKRGNNSIVFPAKVKTVVALAPGQGPNSAKVHQRPQQGN